MTTQRCSQASGTHWSYGVALTRPAAAGARLGTPGFGRGIRAGGRGSARLAHTLPGKGFGWSASSCARWSAH